MKRLEMGMRDGWFAVAGPKLPGCLPPPFGLTLEKEGLARKVPSNTLPEPVLGVSAAGCWV